MQNSREVEEADVVDILRNSSKEFMEFYENERLRRVGRIHWCIDPDRNERIGAEASAESSLGDHKIFLTRFPVILDDSHLIAHEIMHEILSEENKSLKINGIRPFKEYLGTMLEDPIIDLFLQEVYHFNFVDKCCERLESTKLAWRNCEEPKDRLSRIASAVLLAWEMLPWRSIKDRDAIRNWSDFLLWYSDGRPNIFLIGIQLIAIVQKIGLETLDQRKEVFSEIVKNYQLEDFIKLENKLAPKVWQKESSDAAKM